jgi:hypothetical protein
LIIRKEHLEQIGVLRQRHGDDEWVEHVQLEDTTDTLAADYAKDRLYMYHLAYLLDLYKDWKTPGREDHDKALIGDVFLGMPPTGGGIGDAGLRESSQNWIQNMQ